MTNEECIADLKSINATGMECIDYAIKALEQQPSDDVMAIHTQGLDEGIRCAMCTNSIKSDRGCDGGCVVNEDMYKKVMNTINNLIFEQPTSEDCVSRQAVIEYIKACGAELGHDLENESVREDILEMPPVTPTHKKARWIKQYTAFVNDDNQIVTECHCTNCYGISYFRSMGEKLVGAKYCPNCGADMRGDLDVSN